MRKTTPIVFGIAICSATLFAQQPKNIQWNAEIRPFEGTADVVPDKLTKIYSNLGTATDAYSNSGWTLSGPGSALGLTQYVGMPFVSSVDAHVHQVRAALQYLGSGANQANLSLYSDAGGVPGTLLAGPVTVTDLPLFYTCCKLAVASFPTSVAITAGTLYWVVADTPATGTGSDLAGVWAWVPPAKNPVGINGGSGWFGSGLQRGVRRFGVRFDSIAG